MPTDPGQDYVDYVSARLPKLHRAAYLLCGDAHRADDIVQSTITALYVHWARASKVDNIDAYVHRILLRKFVDEKRLSWSRVRLMWDTPERPSSSDDGVGERDALLDALRQLPKGQRTVLVLRYFSDLSIEQTAEVMRCSTGNVKSQTARGLAAMRPLLDSAHRSVTA